MSHLEKWSIPYGIFINKYLNTKINQILELTGETESWIFLNGQILFLKRGHPPTTLVQIATRSTQIFIMGDISPIQVASIVIYGKKTLNFFLYNFYCCSLNFLFYFVFNKIDRIPPHTFLKDFFLWKKKKKIKLLWIKLE